MKKSVSMLILILVFPIVIFGQKQPPRFDKPGTFTILSRTNYTLPECGFTKAEMTANLQKITELVNIIRKKNLVLSNIVGFEGRARIYNTNNCTEYGGYGVPSRISFEFCTWYLSNSGKEELGTIEPPEWSIFINKIRFRAPLLLNKRPVYLLGKYYSLYIRRILTKTLLHENSCWLFLPVCAAFNMRSLLFRL